MQWSNEHDLVFVKELILYEPWRYRQGSLERGQIWKRISEALNSMEKPKFKVTDRSIRDHLNVLMKKFRKKENEERKASGIELDEESELDKAMRDIIELFDDHEKQQLEENQQKKEKAAAEASQAEEFRLNSLETFGQTRKRKNEDDDSPTSSKGRRRSSTDTISFLKEKAEIDRELRKEELDVKKKEIETFQQLLVAQQNQTNVMMQQQQQMNMAFINIMNNLVNQNGNNGPNQPQ